MLKFLLVLTLISNLAFAQESIFLEKDKPAPFEGFLLPKEKVIELRNNTIDMEFYKKGYEIKTKQVDLLIPQLDKATQAVNESRSLTNWERVLYFGAGMILTGLAIKISHEIYR